MTTAHAPCERSLPVTSTSEIEILLEQVQESVLGLHKLMVQDKATTPRRGRPALLPAATLWVAMLLCVLSRDFTQLGIWRMLKNDWHLFTLEHFLLTPQAIYQRLARTKPEFMVDLFFQISKLIAREYTQCPDALAGLARSFKHIVAIDQSKLDPVKAKTKCLRSVPKGDDELLPGSVNCGFEIRRQQWVSVNYIEDPKENEKKKARVIVEALEQGTLILADMGYFSFPWFDYLTHCGHWFVSRFRKKTSFKVMHTLYQGGNHDAYVSDQIGYLGVHRADMAACPVRLVEITVHSSTGSSKTQVFQYITNVLDPRVLSVSDISKLYRRRWDIEQVFNLVKTHLGMSLLSSAQPNAMLNQVFATFIIAQIVLAMRSEIARRSGADVQEVSLALLVREIPKCILQGKNPIEVFVNSGRDLLYIRPCRGKKYILPDADLADYNLPESMPPERTPRYAGRKSGPRPRTAA